VLVAALSLCVVSGCGGDDEPKADPDRVVLAPEAPGAGHTHGPNGAGSTVGDGTTSSAAGYSLTDVEVPQRAGEPGDLSFRIVDDAGKPLLSYTEEQTKQLHLYVVRNDLQDFRHLHPTMADDGTWTTRANLAGPGSYRVITEFAPSSDPKGRQVVLGRSEIVPGTWSPQQIAAATTGDDGILQVTAPKTVRSGMNQRMTLTIADVEGRAPQLGSYLGTYSHLTGFNLETGAFTHAHPYGAPETADDGTRLTFHTEIKQPGQYVFFVQVRVDGFVHTVPVSTTVT
jgi:hypothetical protein